jgi:hypothetical protein
MNEPDYVTLSSEEVDRAIDAAHATRAIASEQSTRLARREERKAVGRRIDPATANVFFEYGQVVDPYGDDPDLPEEWWCVGRMFFAVDPAEGIAVWFGDLPDQTREALNDKRNAVNAEGWRRLLDGVG